MRIAITIALLAALFAAGCGSNEQSTGTTTDARAAVSVSAADLDGRTFVSTAVRGRDLVVGTTVTLMFKDGGLGAKAGCNSIGGPFALDDGVLRWNSAPATTMIGCEPKLQRQDEWLTDFLSSGVSVSTIGANQLTLARDGTVLELRERAR